MADKDKRADGSEMGISEKVRAAGTLEPTGNPALVDTTKATRKNPIGVPDGVVHSSELITDEKDAGKAITDGNDPRLFHGRTEHQVQAGNAGLLIDDTPKELQRKE